MGYQSKTYSLSDKVIEEIKRRVQEAQRSGEKSSPNKVLTDLLWPATKQKPAGG